jgi:geranylgeranyl pyrophosphate synthase
LRQTLQRTNWKITEQEYLDIITDKSASFFSACCRIGAILAEASEERIEEMAAYGLHVGMAFQMTDDVLDLVASSQDVGKPSGLDASTGVVTLPVIHLLRVLGEADREELLNHLHSPEDPSDRLRDLTIRHRSLDYVRSRCKDHIDQALHALEGIDPSDARKALVELAHYTFTRKA